MPDIHQSLEFQLLRIYSYYRTFVSLLLLTMFIAGIGIEIKNEDSARWYLYTNALYVAINILCLILLWRGLLLFSTRLIFGLLVVDVSALIALSYFSGEAGEGIGNLMLICTAIGGIFLSRTAVMGLAAQASLLLLVTASYEIITEDRNFSELFRSGILGFLLFAVALISHYFSRRIQESEQEAREKASEVVNLQKMAELIIERMHTGVLIVTPQEEILFINNAAKTLLQLNHSSSSNETSAPHYLLEHYQKWIRYPEYRVHSLRPPGSDNDIRVSFAALASDMADTYATNTLVFLQDNRLIQREVQQLKLASLGRLTASIAHEIRNPLGAISHAGQLLAESTELSDTDHRMTSIIERHCKRVNQIIDNVLMLSRRRNSSPERIGLNAWLSKFVKEFTTTSGEENQIILQESAQEIYSNIDTSQLEQVLTNLIDNGLRYSEKKTGERKVVLQFFVDKKSDLPIIEVIDFGDGISAEHQNNLFEPFYTTEKSGSGLGLYISKELCEANHAALSYYTNQQNQSVFRVSLPHVNRVIQ